MANYTYALVRDCNRKKTVHELAWGELVIGEVTSRRQEVQQKEGIFLRDPEYWFELYRHDLEVGPYPTALMALTAAAKKHSELVIARLEDELEGARRVHCTQTLSGRS